MCRFVTYLGPPITLASLVLDPPHSLCRQAWAPRHQGPGKVNADGFGVGWYDHDRRAEPARYRTATPIWADRSFASLAGVVASSAVLASVRDATPPSPVEASGVAPFTSGPWLFAHNGSIAGWGLDPGVRAGLFRSVSDLRAAGIEGAADSEVLFAMVLSRLDDGADMVAAMDAVMAAVLEVSPARLNMVLTDGHRLVASARGNSLYVRYDDRSVVVASEPYDESGDWKPVDDGSILEAEPGRATVNAAASS